MRLNDQFLWALTALLPVVFAVLNWIYWPVVQRSGVLPANGDSIMIPMMGGVFLAVIALPFVMGIAWLCLRRFNPEARLSAWRGDRPVRSVAATALFGGVAGLILLGSLLGAARPMPWYEYLWPAYALCWLPWLLGLRAALIEQLDAGEVY